MTKFYDISRQLHEKMIMYKNRSQLAPSISTIKSMEKGDDITESRIGLYLHSGTHIDAPRHMLRQGRDISAIELNNCYGECRVLDFSKHEGEITKEDLSKHTIKKGERILLKTKNTYAKGFDKEFIAIDITAAEYLVEREIKLIGIDGFSVAHCEKHLCHKKLLRAGITVIEGLILDVPASNYTLSAFPLNIKGADASPVRAILIK